jgi:hypothetical protein
MEIMSDNTGFKIIASDSKGLLLKMYWRQSPKLVEDICSRYNSYESNQKLIKDLVKLLKMAKCPDCDGSGIVITKTRDRQYVSRDMAIDAGDRALEGALCQDEEFDYCQCQWCYEKKAIIAAAEKRSEK